MSDFFAAASLHPVAACIVRVNSESLPFKNELSTLDGPLLTVPDNSSDSVYDIFNELVLEPPELRLFFLVECVCWLHDPAPPLVPDQLPALGFICHRFSTLTKIFWMTKKLQAETQRTRSL